MANEPLASGTLDKTPLPHLLVYLDQKGLSGTLAVWPDPAGAQPADKRQDRILMLKGRPVGARLMEPARDLHAGLIRLFSRTEAPYAFYEGNLLGNAEDRLSGRIDPLSLIAASLRTEHTRDDVVASVLGRMGGAQLLLSPDAPIERYQLTPEETGLVELLRSGPQTIETLAMDSALEQMQALRTVYLLVISKALVVQAQPAAASRAPAPPPPPAAPPPAAGASIPPMPSHTAVIPESAPPTPKHAAVIPESEPPLGGRGDSGFSDIPPPPHELEGDLKDRWLAIVAKGKLIDNQNFFEMLDLPKSAKADAAKSAYLQMAKTWHPDRLPKELAALRPYVQTIFGHLSEAHTTLTNEKERVKYVQTVREGGGTPATDRLMQRILESAMEYERVLVMTRKHQYDEALESLKRILHVTKDEPDYHAMYGWLLMQKFPQKPGVRAPYDEMLAAVETALELHRDHEKANLYKALILRRMGRSKEALDYFREVVRINPNNLEAAREVRIANMRGQSLRPQPGKKGKKKEEPTGLLGKFFKKR